jgi:hypothetical protein
MTLPFTELNKPLQETTFIEYSEYRFLTKQSEDELRNKDQSTEKTATEEEEKVYKFTSVKLHKQFQQRSAQAKEEPLIVKENHQRLQR